MQMPPGALLLAALLLVIPFAPAGAQDDSTDGSLSDSDPDRLVPGTQQPDLLIDRPRSWVLEPRENQDPQEPILTGEPADPSTPVVTSQVYTELAAMEAALLRRVGDDEPPRYQPVFNVGTILSSIRFDPPLELEGGRSLDTLDAPRLDWSLATWENKSVEDPETGDEHRRIHLTMQAPVPRPDENGTSPPPGGTDPEDDEADRTTGFQLTWNVLFTDRPLPHPPALLSPAALRFTWTLEGPDHTSFGEEQRLRWVFLFDYDTIRTVVRPEPKSMMDGAYLVSGDHHAALRLATAHLPLDTPEEGEPVRSRLVDLDVRPSAGGDGPDDEGRPLPSPLVLEAHTRPVGHTTSGYRYTGELRFYEAGTGPDDGEGPDDENDEDDGGPGGPTGGWPVQPRLWQALLVLALALVLTVPRRRRSSPSTTP